MLIATLVNLEGEHAEVTVESWRSNVPPYSLLKDNRQFTIDPRGWESGAICTATYNENHPNRTINISGLPMKKLTLTEAEQEEQAA
jgi:hypothetical protein